MSWISGLQAVPGMEPGADTSEALENILLFKPRLCGSLTVFDPI